MSFHHPIQNFLLSRFPGPDLYLCALSSVEKPRHSGIVYQVKDSGPESLACKWPGCCLTRNWARTHILHPNILNLGWWWSLLEVEKDRLSDLELSHWKREGWRPSSIPAFLPHSGKVIHIRSQISFHFQLPDPKWKWWWFSFASINPAHWHLFAPCRLLLLHTFMQNPLHYIPSGVWGQFSAPGSQLSPKSGGGACPGQLFQRWWPSLWWPQEA